MPDTHEPSKPTEASGHLPVLPTQVTELLALQPGRVILDGTLGRGGHAALLIPGLGPGGRYIGLDLDAGNADYSRARLGPIAEKAGVTLTIEQANFRDARAVLKSLEVEAIDGLLADLGFASNQMDDPQRGFAFSVDGPLDMRLNPASDLTAERLVNTLPEADLADLIYEFGEERLSRRIARKIVEARQIEPIETTSRLADLVRRCYPRPRNSPRKSNTGPNKGGKGSRHRIHPATRTFMALRIAVNDELGALDELLADVPRLLTPGGRAAIISFHSLEDRKVKRAYLALKQDRDYQVLTRKPLTADDEECEANPRSRSAKLRVIQKPA